MRKETLLRAFTAVRKKIATADNMAAGWLDERDRRRRQEATFLRGIVRLEGSQRKAAVATGIPETTVRRILDPNGHAKHRADDQARRRGAPRNQKLGAPVAPNLAEEPLPDNVVKLRRRRRPDWQPREPRRAELSKWFEQYLGWTLTAKATARMMLLNSDERMLPDAAYYDDEPRQAKGDSAVGSQKGFAASNR